MLKKSTSQEMLNGERGAMYKETIATSAFIVQSSVVRLLRPCSEILPPTS
jgi:hypothetical protein